MFIYHIPPIDFWAGWLDEATFRKHLELTDEEGDLDRFKEAAFGAARSELRWEGDIREGPFFAGLPTTAEYWSSFMMAWKQDNNGSTFVASPKDLPWLRADGNTDFVYVER